MDERSFQNAKLAGLGLVAYKAFADLAGKMSVFVVTVAAARLLTPQAFGVFSLGTTLGWLLAVVTDFGIQLHVARAIARAPADAAPLVRAWLRTRMATAAGSVAVVSAVAALSGGSAALPLVIFAAAYACAALIEFLNYAYRGLSRTDIESSLTLWHRGAMVVCALLSLAMWRSVTALAAAMLLPAAATLVASIRIARTIGAENTGSIGRAARSWRSDFGQIWPVGAGIVLSALYFRVDVFLVQFWSGTEAVGLYNAVFRLVDALRLFPAAAVAVALPSLCRAADLRPLLRIAVPLTIAGAASAFGLWAAAGWLIPTIFQPRYAAAVPAFRILLLAIPLMAVNLALTHQLVGWNGERAYAALCAAALALNVALNATLIPAWSIDGAAWTTVATEALLTAGCVLMLVRAKTPRTLAGAEVVAG